MGILSVVENRVLISNITSQCGFPRKPSCCYEGAKLWNEIPTKLRTLPKLIFKRKIRMILFNTLESEDSYEDLETIISKVRKYS